MCFQDIFRDCDEDQGEFRRYGTLPNAGKAVIMFCGVLTAEPLCVALVQAREDVMAHASEAANASKLIAELLFSPVKTLSSHNTPKRYNY